MGHNASMCSNKVDEQATLPNIKIRRSKRKCYGCNEKDHEIDKEANKKIRRFLARTNTAFATLAEERDI
jgi:hypothetical protein